MLTDLGKALILFGIVLGAVGALLVAAGRIPWLGRLPGDIVIRREQLHALLPARVLPRGERLVSLLLYLFRR